MTVDEFVGRLDKSKQHGRNWLARCPAHEDRKPSLTVTEGADSRVIVHCFAGCSVESIVGALGLELDALFPERPVPIHEGRARPHRVKFNPHHIIDAVSEEITLLAVYSAMLDRGETPTPEDRARMRVSAARIEEARRFIHD